MTFTERINDWACDHAECTPVTRILSDGRKQYGHQCANCGIWIAKKKTSFAISTLFSEYDEAIKERWLQSRSELYRAYSEKIIQKQTSELDIQRKKWREIYEEFLKSDRWREMRRAVIARDCNMCQACLGFGAQQVHHLRYPSDAKQLYYQPLFELVSVCKMCHDRIHETRKNEQASKD